MLPLALCALSAALANSAEIAYVANAGVPAARVHVVDTTAGNDRPVGPGNWDGAPQWSPDGVWLVFETATDRGRALHVVRPDGTDGRTLDHGRDWNIAPRWSTDGTRVVYSAAAAPGSLTGLMVYDLNAGEETAWGGGGLGLLRPVWMPYSQLMWALDPDKPLEVPGVDIGRFLREAQMSRLSILSGALPEAVVAVQVVPGPGKARGVGTTAVMVTESEVFPFLAAAIEGIPDRDGVVWQVEPSWEAFSHEFDEPGERAFGAYAFSDKGESTRIAYESDEGGDREIYVLGRRGRTNVTNHRAADWNPVWAPDGRRLAFESFRGGRRGIYEVFTDTALVSPLVAREDAAAWSPAWSPDGAQLAFISDRDGVTALQVLHVKDGTTTPIETGPGDPALPSWRPAQPSGATP